VSSDAIPLTARGQFEEHCRAHASAVYVGGGTVLCRVLGRFLCYVDGDDAAVAPHLAIDGFWESWNCVALAGHVRRGWRVVDAGANHGYFTLLLAHLVGPDGRVFAVEPNPRLFELLRRTVKVNGFDDRVTLLPYAAAATEGEAELAVPRGFSGDGSIEHGTSGPCTVCRVRRRRLDTLIDEPVDFLKIDAEGADYDVLEGACGLIRDDRRVDVMLEHHAPFHARPAERLRHVADRGFTLHSVEPEGDLHPRTIEDIGAQRARFWNLWLTHEPLEQGHADGRE